MEKPSPQSPRAPLSDDKTATQRDDESTPLLVEESDAKARPVTTLVNAITAVKVEHLKDKADTAWIKLTKGMVDTKQRMKRSPWILSLVIVVACMGVIWAGLFDVISYVLRFRPITILMKVYQVLFGLLCLIVEASRYPSFLNNKAFIHRWLPFMELSLGRGLVQVLTAGLAVGHKFLAADTLFALTLGGAGLFNVAWGVRCFLKLRRIFKELKTEMNDEKGSDPQQSLLLIQRKFAALDLNGDGRLSREELSVGCRTLNISLEEEELSAIFELLDPQGKGYVKISDFEAWWYAEKGLLGLFV